MKLSRTLSALFIVAILAPMPAAASGLTTIEQGRPVSKSVETLRQRIAERRAIMAERRQTQVKRSASLRADARERKLSSARGRKQLRHRLEAMKRRMARRRAIRRF
jgi:hypothetical protein